MLNTRITVRDPRCGMLIVSIVDRSPGDITDDEDAHDFQDFSSNDELSDTDAGDERPSHLSKLHATRSNFSSQVCHLAMQNGLNFITILPEIS